MLLNRNKDISDTRAAWRRIRWGVTVTAGWLTARVFVYRLENGDEAGVSVSVPEQ